MRTRLSSSGNLPATDGEIVPLPNGPVGADFARHGMRRNRLIYLRSDRADGDWAPLPTNSGGGGPSLAGSDPAESTWGRRSLREGRDHRALSVPCRGQDDPVHRLRRFVLRFSLRIMGSALRLKIRFPPRVLRSSPKCGWRFWQPRAESALSSQGIAQDIGCSHMASSAELWDDCPWLGCIATDGW